MPIMTPEEIEGLRRQETINAVAQASRRSAGLLGALQSGSYTNEEGGDGFYDDTSGEWMEYFKAGDLAGVNPVMP